MGKCHITGVWLRPEDAYVLNISEAHAIAHDLRTKLREVESLLEQLGKYDEVELVGRKKDKSFKRMDCRLVTSSMAEVLGRVFPERPLFIPWVEWHQNGARRREELREMFRRKTET